MGYVNEVRIAYSLLLKDSSCGSQMWSDVMLTCGKRVKLAISKSVGDRHVKLEWMPSIDYGITSCGVTIE
jgi:hypothetical protein